MRILVTGGAGFIGSILVDRLLAEGHAVDVIDNLSTGSFANLAEARMTGSHQFSFHQLDVRSPDIAVVISRRRPEVIYHLAAQVDPVLSTTDPVLDADINIGGSLRVLEAARSSGVAKIVFTSSGGPIYGEVEDWELPIKESHRQRPRSPLGVAKKAVTDYLVAYRERYDLEFCSLALANVYGPRQDRKGSPGVMAVFARRLLAGQRCSITGDGAQSRDFVYVDDVVDALARAAGRGGGLLINVGTGVETTINELYEVMAAVVGGRVAALRVPALAGDARRCVLDPSLAAMQLGWKPWTSLAEGSVATLDWLRSGARD